jgi:integrase
MSARELLTDKAIDRAKPAAPGKRYVLWDTYPKSLGLCVTGTGHKSFIVQRRVGGRMVKLTLGDYPVLSLAQARDLANAALANIDEGVDPRPKKGAPIKASAVRPDSFSAAVETYLDTVIATKRPKYQSEVTRYLRKTYEPVWGARPLDTITRADVKAVLAGIAKTGKLITANRARSAAYQFFEWAITEEKVDANPVVKVTRPLKEEPGRDRVLSDAELREVWLAAEKLGWPFGPLVRGLILTGQRRNEVGGMQWTEVNREERDWKIPAARVKNGFTHIVPISEAFEQILDAVPRFGEGEDDGDNQLVFTTNGTTAVSGFSRAKHRLDELIRHERRAALERAGGNPDKAKALPPWTFHDLRRSCTTGMQRLGIAPHVIEAVINHKSSLSGVRRIYQRHEYLDERRRALEAWGKHVLGLLRPASRENVVEFKTPGVPVNAT